MVKKTVLCVLLVFGIGILFSRTAVAAPLASKVGAVIQTILSY